MCPPAQPEAFCPCSSAPIRSIDHSFRCGLKPLRCSLDVPTRRIEALVTHQRCEGHQIILIALQEASAEAVTQEMRVDLDASDSGVLDEQSSDASGGQGASFADDDSRTAESSCALGVGIDHFSRGKGNWQSPLF